MTASIGILTIHLHIPGCSSLKEKRGRLSPLFTKLHKTFNLSVAEIDQQDVWQNAVIACALVSNDKAHTQRVLMKVQTWIDEAWRDVSVLDDTIELF